MDALVTSIVMLSLAEMGDRPQLLCAALAIRFQNKRAVLFGLIAATCANSFLSAYAGSYVNDWISREPVQIFFALSLLLAGLAMVAWRRKLDLLENWRLGAFWTTFPALAILQFGDKGQFLIAANAARTDQWLWAAIGGSLGIVLACAPAIYLQERLGRLVPLDEVRRIGGMLFIGLGTVIALSTWGIIG